MLRYFERAGRLISYIEAGNPAAADRRGTLVLVHAFPLSAEIWESQLAAAPAGWRVVAPDVAGFGRSFPVPHTATFDDDAHDLLALLNHLGEKQAVVAGVSMGGYIAFALLRAAPERVRGLVLADTRAEADTDPARRARQEMLETLERGGVAAVVDAMLPKLLGHTTHASRPAVVARARAIGLRQSPDGIRAAIHRLMGRPDSTPQLSAIRCPVLVVAGTEDAIIGPEVVRGLQQRIPGARLSLIDEAGHLPNLERPDAFNAALAGFL
jgi:pimeloyl-ACP methyl ester carboxylesterase